MPRKPRIYRDPGGRRAVWQAAAIGALLLAFIGGATWHMKGRSAASGAFTGEVVGREFTPAPERQITIGRGGLDARDVAGEFLLRVKRPEDGRIFNVWVDQATYEATREGQPFLVIPTP